MEWEQEGSGLGICFAKNSNDLLNFFESLSPYLQQAHLLNKWYQVNHVQGRKKLQLDDTCLNTYNHTTNTNLLISQFLMMNFQSFDRETGNSDTDTSHPI